MVEQKLEQVLGGTRAPNLSRLARTGMRRVLGDPIVIELNGFQIQGPFDSRWMLARIKAGYYEPFERLLFEDALESGMEVLDVGAAIGLYSLLASRAVGARGTVHSFEADPRSVVHLNANILANDCRNVTVVPKAVGERQGAHVFRMAEDPTHSGLFMSMRGMPVTSTVEIEVVSVDQLLADVPRVDVIKMDIEGGEPAAVRGMMTTLTANPNLKMFIEFEPPALEAAGERPEDFLDLLRSLFSEVSVIDEAERRLIPLSEARLDATQSLYCCRGRT